MMITGTKLAKALPEAFSKDDLKAMKAERNGKNWVSWCNDTFQGGYIAVHNYMTKGDKSQSKRVVVSQSYKQAALKFAKNPDKTQLALFGSSPLRPADRATAVLSQKLDEISFTSRKFLCQLIVQDMRRISPKQEKWLSDLEA